MRSRAFVGLGVLFLLTGLLAVATHDTLAEPAFNPQVVIPRAFPAITNPQIVTRQEADAQLNESELVLAVEIDGKARAYPINMLTGPRREIINDELGGRAIAATW